VDDAAEEAIAKIGLRRRTSPKAGDIDTEALLAYPPDNALSAQEELALRSMKLSAVQRSALQKLIADGCATAFFHFFNLIDATGDPEVKPPRGTWLGAWLVAPSVSCVGLCFGLIARSTFGLGIPMLCENYFTPVARMTFANAILSGTPSSTADVKNWRANSGS